MAKPFYVLSDIVPSVKQTLFAKLEPSKEQFNALKLTMERFNEACNFIAPVAYENHTANKMRLQPLVYYSVREKFGLSAQMAIRAIAKVCEAYKRDKTIQPSFRLDGAMVYDQRILSWKGLSKVSVLTLKGRQIIPVRLGEYQKARIDRLQGQVDLVLRRGIFYLAVVVDAPEPTPYDPVGVLGVDLGIVNLAVDSDGESYSGKDVDKVRVKIEALKASLQKRETKSARRHLKKLSGREARFRHNVNHVVSKRLVAKAKDTQRMIALEDLKGIRGATVVRKPQRRRHSSWAFRQLRSFVEYKSAMAGVPLTVVNPRGTSHTCPKCQTVDKRSRPTRDFFKCISCGYAGVADHVGALNIAHRATVNRPIVSGFKHCFAPQGQAPSVRVG